MYICVNGSIVHWPPISWTCPIIWRRLTYPRLNLDQSFTWRHRNTFSPTKTGVSRLGTKKSLGGFPFFENYQHCAANWKRWKKFGWIRLISSFLGGWMPISIQSNLNGLTICFLLYISVDFPYRDGFPSSVWRHPPDLHLSLNPLR